MTRKTVLVLGASGFIGRRIVRQLVDAPWARPIAASRRFGASPFDPSVETLLIDGTDPSAIAQAVSTADGVISCIAGEPRQMLECDHALIAALARLTTPPKLVWLGSMAAYGSARGAVDEGAPLLGDLGPYSAAKAKIDVLMARHPFAIRLRPGIVYGPESPWWSDRVARLLVARRLGILGRRGEGYCNLVYVDDVAAAAVSALRRAEVTGEVFNLGSENPPTWNQYFSCYGEALGGAPVRQIGPSQLAFELRIRGPLLKIAEALLPRNEVLASTPAIRPWLMGLCQQPIRLIVRKAESALGVQWLPLEAGLKQTAAWFVAGGRTP